MLARRQTLKHMEFLTQKFFDTSWITTLNPGRHTNYGITKTPSA